MMTFFDILRLHKIEPSTVRLVRHGNKEIPIHDTFLNDYEKFESYQCFQGLNRFGAAKHICTFSPARGTTALFLGVWSITGRTENKNFTQKHRNDIRKHRFPESWLNSPNWYDLKRNPALNEFSERLVIDWGKSTRSWVQRKDKPIVEIKTKNSIGEFVSYDHIQLSYSDIRKLAKDSDSNPTWVNALSSVNGIYLIRDTTSGRLYVGSAYGGKGIWGRWCSYAVTGHGGNKELRSLNPKSFEFSILEIIPSTYSANDVIEREQRWMSRLGTRAYGLN